MRSWAAFAVVALLACGPARGASAQDVIPDPELESGELVSQFELETWLDGSRITDIAFVSVARRARRSGAIRSTREV